MKLFMILILVICCACEVKPQEREFTIHDNGLIYNATTMYKLGRIVDSLNLKFKSCDVKDYRSFAQGNATYFHLKSDIKQAKELIHKNVNAEEFAAAFPAAHPRKEWIIKSPYTDYKNHKRIEYASLPLRNKPQIELDFPSSRANDKSVGWIVSEDDDGLAALYLHGISELPIPSGYARLIQYVDCMIDTSAQIYRVDRADFDKELQPDSKIKQFLDWANRFDGEPEISKVDEDSPFAEVQYAKYHNEHEQWNNKRLAALDQKMAKGHYYKSLLMEAADEAITEKTGNADLEFYVERYLSAEQALQMKRNRKPLGYCSMDSRPREHAASICRLAAETSQWDIFLRAHLDIMNDRFDRQSDGSYAWAGRGTYLRELEELDINALDLLIGTSLRSINVNNNHYFGDIGRIGRALSETNTPEVLVKRLVAMIEDEKLDLFNRLLMCYLFDNFIHNQTDEVKKSDYQNRFLTATQKLPEDIAKTFIAKND